MTTYLYEIHYKYPGALDWMIMSEHETLIEAEKDVKRVFKYAPHLSTHRIVKLTITPEVVYESSN